MKDQRIDCVGDICPVPLLKAKVNYRRLKENESITIVTDHSCSSENIKDYFKNLKADVSAEEIDGIWYITIKKKP